MSEKRHYIPGVTGIGTLIYPKVVTPDNFGKFADGKYKTDFVLKDKKEGNAFFAELQQKAKEIFGNADVMLPVKKTKAGKIVKDDDGNYVFKFKSSKKPVLYDAKRKKVPGALPVRGGTQARIAYTLTNYDDGLVLWPESLQIIELVAGNPGASAFSEADGFDADEYDYDVDGSATPETTESDAAGEDKDEALDL